VRSRWGWGLGALALLLAGWGWYARTANDGPVVELGAVETRNEFRSYVTASGEIVAERFADIGSSSMGRVVELPVIEGQQVREGDLLARIDPVQARSELTAAEAGIRALEAEAGAAGEQLRSAEAELRLARARAREATLNRERIAALHAQELVSQADLEAAEAGAESAEAQAASAAAAVSRVAGSGAAAQTRVAQARAQAARARDLLSKTAIEAPIAGVVSRLQVRHHFLKQALFDRQMLDNHLDDPVAFPEAGQVVGKVTGFDLTGILFQVKRRRFHFQQTRKAGGSNAVAHLCTLHAQGSSLLLIAQFLGHHVE